MTACGGNLIGCEITRNKQSAKQLRRLRVRASSATLTGMKQSQDAKDAQRFNVLGWI